jgi:hypothetical protein
MIVSGSILNLIGLKDASTVSEDGRNFDPV